MICFLKPKYELRPQHKTKRSFYQYSHQTSSKYLENINFNKNIIVRRSLTVTIETDLKIQEHVEEFNVFEAE